MPRIATRWRGRAGRGQAVGAEVLGMPHHDPEPDPELDRVAERTAYLSDALDDALPLLTAAELADLIGKLMPAIIGAGGVVPFLGGCCTDCGRPMHECEYKCDERREREQRESEANADPS